MTRKTVPAGTPYRDLPEKEFWGYDRSQHPSQQKTHFFPVAARSMLFYSLCKRLVANRSKVEPVLAFSDETPRICAGCEKRHAAMVGRLLGL